MDEQMIELPRGHDFIDEEALDRWRDRSGKGGHDFSANNNTVWRLVATIDHYRAAHSVMAGKVAELTGERDELRDERDALLQKPIDLAKLDSIDEDASGKMVAYYWWQQAQDARATLAHPKGME